ncbi:MAG: PhoU domain-containing protein [Candidatus Omnitrophota bacterium]
MFKNMLDFWKGKDFLTNVLGEFGEMLDDSKKMFDDVCQNLLENKKIDGLEDKIYSVDKRINLFEKDIRKRIIAHLSIQPSVDVPMSLLMMSVVKDAERLGDYAKNIFQVGRVINRPIDKNVFSKYFNEIDKKIMQMFDDTKTAFIDSDEEKARQIWKTERLIVKRCDAIVVDVAKSSLTVDQAVAFALIARYFKRIVAHLTNIATSVILPISELDFFDESRRSEDDKA